MISLTLTNALWAAGFMGHVSLLVVLFIRKRNRQFPVFTSLIAFQAFVTALLFVVNRDGSHHSYVLAFWGTGFVDYAFQIALIFEIARIVLRPTGAWVRDAQQSFLLGGGLGLLLAAAVAFTLGSPYAKGLDLWDERVTLFTSLLTCELFAAMIISANRLGLQWRSHVVALGQGLTVWALLTLGSNVLHVLAGWQRDFSLYDGIREFAYLGALLFWIVSFWLPEAERAPLSPNMEAYLLALHRRVQYDLDNVHRT